MPLSIGTAARGSFYGNVADFPGYPCTGDMKRRLIPILAPETLHKQPTKQLLGRLRALQRCEQSSAFSDLTAEEIAACTGILFKDSPEWRSAYGHLKAILATREHVSSAAERTRIRLERGRLKPDRRAKPKSGADGRRPLCSGTKR